MPVPSGAYAMKKLAGSYLSTPVSNVTIMTTQEGVCDYQNPNFNCVATATLELDNPDNAVLSDIVWSTITGTITSGQNTTIVSVASTSDVNQVDKITCNLLVDGNPFTIFKNITYRHTDISPPISITGINLESGGSCSYDPGETCQTTSVYRPTLENGNGTVSYKWSVTGDGSISGTDTSKTVTVLGLDDSTDDTYTVTCTVTDKTGSDSISQEFTDTKTENVVVPQVIRRLDTPARYTTNSSVYNTPAGTNRIVFIAIMYERNEGNKTVTWNGATAYNTAALSIGSVNAGVQLFYVDEAFLLANGESGTIVWTGNGLYFDTAYVWTIENAEQTVRGEDNDTGTNIYDYNDTTDNYYFVNITSAYKDSAVGGITINSTGTPNAPAVLASELYNGTNSFVTRGYINDSTLSTAPGDSFVNQNINSITITQSSALTIDTGGRILVRSHTGTQTIVDTDGDGLTDVVLTEWTNPDGTTGSVNEDANSVHIDVDGDGKADIIFVKKEDDK